MKKKNFVLITSLMLAVLLVAGGTFAWFTAKADPIVNEFEAGTIEIELHEEFEPVTNLNPGDCYEKVIYVENTGSKKAYIRIKADAVWTPRSGVNASELSGDVIGYGVNAPRKQWTWPWGYKLIPGWTYKDGYFYYDTVVQPGGHTKPLLKCNRVCFDGEGMGNEYQGAKLDITINADAIQATHGAAQAVWGVTFPTVRTLMSGEEPVEEKLTIEDVKAIIAEEEAAFEALEIE